MVVKVKNIRIEQKAQLLLALRGIAPSHRQPSKIVRSYVAGDISAVERRTLEVVHVRITLVTTLF